jgi:hypothetical protein
MGHTKHRTQHSEAEARMLVHEYNRAHGTPNVGSDG